jgi:hypothetical protein
MIREGDNMLRTQVSLEESDYRLAKKEAAGLGISVAEYVRRAIRQALPASPRRSQPRWMRYAGLVESGNAQSSRSIDEVVYGHKD